MATLAREDENRDAVVYWNDLARQAQPGGLLRPSSDEVLDADASGNTADSSADVGDAGEAGDAAGAAGEIGAVARGAGIGPVVPGGRAVLRGIHPAVRMAAAGSVVALVAGDLAPPALVIDPVTVGAVGGFNYAIGQGFCVGAVLLFVINYNQVILSGNDKGASIPMIEQSLFRSLGVHKAFTSINLDSVKD